jgi:hypothetical protein
MLNELLVVEKKNYSLEHPSNIYMGLKRGAIGNTLGEHIENLGNILGTDGTH